MYRGLIIPNDRNNRQVKMNAFVTRCHWYVKLVRLDKPIGIVLLLWPTLVAIWLASAGDHLKLLAEHAAAGVDFFQRHFPAMAVGFEEGRLRLVAVDFTDLDGGLRHRAAGAKQRGSGDSMPQEAPAGVCKKCDHDHSFSLKNRRGDPCSGWCGLRQAPAAALKNQNRWRMPTCTPLTVPPAVGTFFVIGPAPLSENVAPLLLLRCA